ncbi:hypothetical protein [uncultured Flavobacterium sp.]|uniref:hypothetical protein n=1 Tax=uncultured Flavobacterium sp. TaxID=165435 RepID=UPI0030C808DB
MKKNILLIIVIAFLCSCSNNNEEVDKNPCNFQNLGINESAKYPLTPESSTAVWNWKIANDTLKVQTSYYFNGFDTFFQTYYFKINDKCVTPLFVKQYYSDDTMYQEYRKANFDVIIEEYAFGGDFKFRVNSFSNIFINDQPYTNPSNPNYNPYFFKSPNGNEDIWVMLNNTQGASNYYDGFGF